MKTLIKEKVCASCLSNDIVDINCRCTYDKKYPIIELEFEKCECCGHISAFPANTEFNNKQLKEE